MCMYTHTNPYVPVLYCDIVVVSQRRSALGLQRQVYLLLVLFREMHCFPWSGVSVLHPCLGRDAQHKCTQKPGALSFHQLYPGHLMG